MLLRHQLDDLCLIGHLLVDHLLQLIVSIIIPLPLLLHGLCHAIQRLLELSLECRHSILEAGSPDFS